MSKENRNKEQLSFSFESKQKIHEKSNVVEFNSFSNNKLKNAFDSLLNESKKLTW